MKTLTLAILLAAAGVPFTASAEAQGLKPSWLYVQGGLGESGTASATVGAAWPTQWRGGLFGSEVSYQTEFYVSQWTAHAIGGGRQSLTQLGLVPVFRFRFDEGRSDWFAEAGIGVSWLDKIYHTPDKQFSTAGNFHDTVGIGLNFGKDRGQELGLRVTHYSNASIKRPNPGANFLQLRYGVRF